jgi:hypothetical protein
MGRQCPSRAAGDGKEPLGDIAVRARSLGWSEVTHRSRGFTRYGAVMSGPAHTVWVPAELKTFEGPSFTAR